MSYDLSPPRHRANFNPAHPHADTIWPMGSQPPGSAHAQPRDAYADDAHAAAGLSQEDIAELIGVPGAVEAEGASPASSPRRGAPPKRWWPATVVGWNNDGTVRVDVEQAGRVRWASVRLGQLRHAPEFFDVDELLGHDYDAVAAQYPAMRAAWRNEALVRAEWGPAAPAALRRRLASLAAEGVFDRAAPAPAAEEAPGGGGGGDGDAAAGGAEGEAVPFVLRRRAGEAWGLDINDLWVVGVADGSPAEAAGVQVGRLVAIDRTEVASMADCAVLRDAASVVLWVVPAAAAGTAEGAGGAGGDDDAAAEEEEYADAAPPPAAADAERGGPRRGVHDLSPPRHRGDFDAAHPHAEWAWPRDCQPPKGPDPRAARHGDGACGDDCAAECTSHAAFSRRKQGHSHRIDACRSSPRASPSYRHDDSWIGGAHDGRGDECGTECTSHAEFSRRKQGHSHTMDGCRSSPRARAACGHDADAADCGAECTSHSEFTRRKHGHAHEMDACRSSPRHHRHDRHGHDHADGECGAECTSHAAFSRQKQGHAHTIDACRSSPRASPRHGHGHDHAAGVGCGEECTSHAAFSRQKHGHAHQLDGCRSPRSDASPRSAAGRTPVPAPRSEEERQQQTPPARGQQYADAPSAEEMAGLFGVGGVLEANGASGRGVWWPCTVLGHGTLPGTFRVDVYQHSTVRWNRTELSAFRYSGGGRPADLAALSTQA